MKKEKFTYEKSGVNINAADNFVKFISSISSNNKGKKKFQNIYIASGCQIKIPPLSCQEKIE